MTVADYNGFIKLIRGTQNTFPKDQRMAKDGRAPYSHLFTVRLWNEPLGQGQMEVRGEAKHLLSGEVRYFRTWTVLEAFFVQQLAESRDEGGNDETRE